jgi:hypothetical protein
LVVQLSTKVHRFGRAQRPRRGEKTELPTFEEFTDLVGLPEIREQERRYAACGREG